MNGTKNHPLIPTCQHISSQPFMSLLGTGRKIIFKQAAFLPIDPHGAAPPVNFFLLKKGWCRPQLSSWVQCQLRLCQWCPVETYCRHTGACIGFGRTFRNEAFKCISLLITSRGTLRYLSVVVTWNEAITSETPAGPWHFFHSSGPKKYWLSYGMYLEAISRNFSLRIVLSRNHKLKATRKSVILSTF